MLEAIHNLLTRIYASVSGVLSVNLTSVTGAVPVTQWTGDNTNGVYTAMSAPTAVSVTNSSGVLIAENQNANYRYFYNPDATAILYISSGTATTTSGIVINPKESFEMSAKKGNLYRGALNAISSVATKTCIVVEGS